MAAGHPSTTRSDVVKTVVDLATKISGAGPSDTSGLNELTLPISYQPGYMIQSQDAHFNGNFSVKSYPPSAALLAPISEEIIEDETKCNDQPIGPGARENMDHSTTIIIPEPHICRICDDPEEEEVDDVLVELGCRCKGQLSRMHRECILQWYCVRMILQRNRKCEICKALLHPAVQLIVSRGVADTQNGGRDILMNALKSAMAGVHATDVNIDNTATYQEARASAPFTDEQHVSNAAATDCRPHWRFRSCSAASEQSPRTSVLDTWCGCDYICSGIVCFPSSPRRQC